MKVTYLALFGLMFLFSGTAYSAETTKKTECPTECKLRAKAALALAATAKPVTTTAPLPKVKTACVGECECLSLFGVCVCKEGQCPCCAKSKGKTDPKPTPATPPMQPIQPKVTYFQQGNVIYECSNGTCRPVGTTQK